MLYYTLQSLARQSVKADEIRVNISREPYLQDEGVLGDVSWLGTDCTVSFVDNTGPYRKLLPVIADAADDDRIVTIDDDVLYGVGWLESLLKTSDAYPEAIVAGSTRIFSKDWRGNCANYHRWRPCYVEACSLEHVPIGVGGVVYRKKLMDSELLFDEHYLQIAPKTDDLWFKACSMRAGTPVASSPKTNSDSFTIQHNFGLREGNLPRQNTGGVKSILVNKATRTLHDWFGVPMSENDRAWKRICEYAGISV
jgi:hypothetical protein